MTHEATLGTSARVTVSSKTIELAQQGLNSRKKTMLRRTIVLEYIKSRPYGEFVFLKDIQLLCKFSNRANTSFFINKMMQEGLLEKVEVLPRRFSYAIPEYGNGKSHTIKAATPTLTIQEIEQKAIQFSWQNDIGQNDLRSFIAWIKDYSGGIKT